MYMILKEIAAGYTAVRISMKAGLLANVDKTTAEITCECVACYATGIVCALILPITAPIGVVWASVDAYQHRDQIVQAGVKSVQWLRKSWRERRVVEVPHAHAVGEN